MGPGYSAGCGSGGWTISKLHEEHFDVNTRGISQCYNILPFNGRAVGDKAMFYGYYNGIIGLKGSGDEGVTGMTLQVNEDQAYFRGAVRGTTGTGDTAPVFQYVSGAGGYMADGTNVLNISKMSYAGTFNATDRNNAATPFGGGNWIRQIPTTGTNIPLCTAWGTVTAGLLQQVILQADTVQTVLTVSVGSIGSAPQAFVNGPAFLAGTSFPEQVIISNAGPLSNGVQQVTVSLRTWNDGACLFQGGLAGQFLSLDSVVAATAMRTNYNVVGSIDGTNLIYAHYLFDRTDFIQWQPFKNASFNGADAGFHVYPGAEIVSITQKFATGNPLLYTCLLEQNGVAWAVGDQIENPRPNVWGGTGVWINTFIGSPTLPGFGGELLNLDYGGAGMHGGVAALRGHNRQDASYYLGLGGKGERTGGISLPRHPWIGNSFGISTLRPARLQACTNSH